MSLSEKYMDRVGTWFYLWGFWIVPKSIENSFLRALKNVNRAFRKTKNIEEEITRLEHRREGRCLSPKQEAEVTHRLLELDLQIMGERQTILYNSQPVWTFLDVGPKSLAAAEEVVGEFMDLLPYARNAFSWVDYLIPDRMDWRKHGWKQIYYDSIKDFADDVRDTQWPPPQVRLELLGTDDEIRELLVRAARRDPWAVARLNCLFPNRDEMVDAVRDVLGDEVSADILQSIPSASQLGADYVAAIIRRPDSKDAEDARKALRQLTSLRAAKGADMRVGRLPIPYDQETVETVYIMGQALFQQLRQVDHFIGEFQPRRQARTEMLLRFYPWLAKVESRDLLGFLQQQPSHAAYRVAAHFLDISPGKIKQLV
jgi:hypothetical protein